MKRNDQRCSLPKLRLEDEERMPNAIMKIGTLTNDGLCVTRARCDEDKDCFVDWNEVRVNVQICTEETLTLNMVFV